MITAQQIDVCVRLLSLLNIQELKTYICISTGSQALQMPPYKKGHPSKSQCTSSTAAKDLTCNTFEKVAQN